MDNVNIIIEQNLTEVSISETNRREIELRNNDNTIEYRYIGDTDWTSLITIQSMSTFLDLADTPSVYTGSAGRFIAVKSDLSGLEFVAPSGAGDMLASVYDPNNVNANVFNTDNHVDGINNKVYTTTEKIKLSGISEGAEVNVQSDWNAESGDALILNKPTIPSNISDLTNDSGFITSASVPTALSELSDDSTHRLTTDTEKSTWNGKQDALGFTPLNSTSFSGLTKITVGTIQPSNPSIGDLWIDTN